jgi:hypothetical protein
MEPGDGECDVVLGVASLPRGRRPVSRAQAAEQAAVQAAVRAAVPAAERRIVAYSAE